MDPSSLFSAPGASFVGEAGPRWRFASQRRRAHRVMYLPEDTPGTKRLDQRSLGDSSSSGCRWYGERPAKTVVATLDSQACTTRCSCSFGVG